MIYTLIGYVFTGILFILGIWSLFIALFDKSVTGDTKVGLCVLFFVCMFSSLVVAAMTGI